MPAKPISHKLPHLQHEKNYWDKGFHVIGIDEVGRGPLAGPVTVGGVCFDMAACDDLLTLGINDSKKLKESKRRELCELIKDKSRHWSISCSDVTYINTYGIVSAINRAVQTVVSDICTKIADNKPAFLLLDQMGDCDSPPVLKENKLFLVKGDSTSISIAAASIIAKVHRDEIMNQLADLYPHYGWEENKGYATKFHRNGILHHDISPFHRTLYVRNILKSKSDC